MELSEEEKIERLLNSIAKGCDGSIADEVKAIIIKQQKEIERLEKDNDTLSELVIVNEDKVIKELDLISKDKIMAKIEELEKQAKEMKYDYDASYAEEDLFNKNVKFFKEQMQELLEEPKLLEEN